MSTTTKSSKTYTCFSATLNNSAGGRRTRTGGTRGACTSTTTYRGSASPSRKKSDLHVKSRSITYCKILLTLTTMIRIGFTQSPIKWRLILRMKVDNGSRQGNGNGVLQMGMLKSMTAGGYACQSVTFCDMLPTMAAHTIYQ